MAGPMYQLGSPCGAHDALSVGQFFITTPVTSGSISVQFPIGGDVLLISKLYLGLLLLDEVFCPTIGGGSLYLHCIVPL